MQPWVWTGWRKELINNNPIRWRFRFQSERALGQNRNMPWLSQTQGSSQSLRTHAPLATSGFINFIIPMESAIPWESQISWKNRVDGQTKKEDGNQNLQSVHVAFKSFISLNSCYSSDVGTDFTAEKTEGLRNWGLIQDHLENKRKRKSETKCGRLHLLFAPNKGADTSGVKVRGHLHCAKEIGQQRRDSPRHRG